MRLTFCIALRVMVIGLAAIVGSACNGTEIWTGPPIAFEKQAFADPTDAANQDRITDNVWITRASSTGIYNAAMEEFYQSFLSPADTLWAVGTAANADSLEFDNWQAIVGPGTDVGGPPNSVGLDMVMYLVTDDVLIDIKFLSWGIRPSEGGAFSYQRSTQGIPEPSAAGLLVVAAASAFGTGRWRRRHSR